MQAQQTQMNPDTQHSYSSIHDSAPYQQYVRPAAVGPNPNILYSTPNEPSEQQSKGFGTWKSIFVIAFVCIAYGVISCYNLEATVYSHDDQINLLIQDTEDIQQEIYSIQGINTKPRNSIKNKDASNLFELNQYSDELVVTCNGTNLCTTLGTVNYTQNQENNQLSSLSASINQLEVTVNMQSQEIAILQNNTNGSAYNYFYLKNLTTGGDYLITATVQLQDGRIAVTANSYSKRCGPSVLIFNVQTGSIVANLSSLNGSYEYNNLIQLQDGRLLLTATNVDNTSSILQFWSVSNNSLIQSYYYDFVLISVIQVSTGYIAILDTTGFLTAHNPSAFNTGSMSLKVQNAVFSTNPQQLVEYKNGSTPLLVVLSNDSTIVEVNINTWVVSASFTLTLAQPLSFTSLYTIGGVYGVAIGDYVRSPMLFDFSQGTYSAILNTTWSLTAGMIGSGLLGTTSKNDADLSIWNSATGQLLRVIEYGMVPGGYNIVTLSGVMTGFAVSSYNHQTISIYISP